MKKVIYLIIPLALIAGAVMRLKQNKEKTESRIYTYDKNQAINVEADTLSISDIDAEFAYSGMFEAFKESKISAEAQGKINAIYADAGSYVKKGQILAKIDDALLTQQLNALNVQIQNAKAEFDIQLQANQIQIDGLETDITRYKILAAADAVQGIQLEKAELQLKTAQNQRKTIIQQSALKNLEAQKNLLIEQINKTTIYAPFDGVVTLKLSEIGAFATPGAPILQITDIRQLKFTLNVPENDLALFEANKAYPISADAYPDLNLSGKTTLISSKANAGNSFPIQFTVNNTPDLKIKAGQFGKLQLKNGTGEKGIIIPSSAIVGSAEQAQIYVVKAGKAILQNISISKRMEQKAVITGNINTGDLIVTNGFINLFDGANVSVKN
jgi:membrane fusion protein (multidrug efflux system)